ncbi:MAG: c-type cytochrome [Bacteroidota bacterium]|nr:c-type cytochrome [Bacteroidota bacterium]
MKRKYTIACILLFAIGIGLSRCNTGETPPSSKAGSDSAGLASTAYGGYSSQVKWGAHLVTIAGCNDCHTPKKMSPQGPVPDMDLELSGHPAASKDLPVDRKEMASKGLVVTGDLTEWVGPWGVSYTANITSDSTGIGSWKEDQFIYCLRHGKWMGLPQERDLLPPMPWQGFAQMSDDELKAVFAYLKSTKPIHNIVPAPKPPVVAMK